MRFLGIDYGSVRVGLALSDETGMLATPLETVENSKAIIRIQTIVREKNVQMIIVGMPRNMNNSYGQKAEEVRRFIQLLEKQIVIPVKPWDERFTTQSVERMLIQTDISRKRRKEVIDKLAAQQILQSYLDSLPSQSS